MDGKKLTALKFEEKINGDCDITIGGDTRLMMWGLAQLTIRVVKESGLSVAVALGAIEQFIKRELEEDNKP